MPFLLPLIPAAIAAGSSAAVGAGVNAVGKALSGDKGPQQVNVASPVGADQAQAAMGQASGAVNQQQNLANQLAAQNGIGNQSQVYGQQQALASQLGQMAQGNGPSVARTQLANTTGANVANQAALMAGQRGAGANAGLIARQAAQQGGALQQQAAGQGAQLKAQEQLNAVGALQQQQGMLGNLATQQVGQQANAVGNLNQFAQGNQGQLLNSIAGAQSTAAQQQQGANQITAQQQMQNQQNTAGLTKGISSGLGSAITSAVMPKTAAPAEKLSPNGDVASRPMFAQGGQIGMPAIMKENYKGSSKIGMHLMAKGGPVQMEQGGGVPGQAKVPGARDSYANDVVDAKLSPGEIVLPRSVTMSKDPVAAAAKFVAALKGKR